LLAYPVPRLWDMYRSADKRAKATSAAQAKPAAKPDVKAKASAEKTKKPAAAPTAKKPAPKKK
jgi:hypothetical protein